MFALAPSHTAPVLLPQDFSFFCMCKTFLLENLQNKQKEVASATLAIVNVNVKKRSSSLIYCRIFNQLF